MSAVVATLSAVAAVVAVGLNFLAHRLAVKERLARERQVLYETMVRVLEEGAPQIARAHETAVCRATFGDESPCTKNSQHAYLESQLKYGVDLLGLRLLLLFPWPTSRAWMKLHRQATDEKVPAIEEVWESFETFLNRARDAIGTDTMSREVSGLLRDLETKRRARLPSTGEIANGAVTAARQPDVPGQVVGPSVVSTP